MPRAPDQRVAEAKALFDQGLKLVEIASRLEIPVGTIRSWKNRYQWDCNVAKKKRNVAKHRGGQKGNRNAAGHGAPKKNKNAEKYGFFSKYLPEETREIFLAIEQADPLDLLWHQIQIAYTAIIRAQKIAYVKDRNDKTVEKVEEKDGNVIGERWEVQQAWDKQNEFLKAQARAQAELRSMIKQYDEMLHKDWEMASEEQRSRIDVMRKKADEANGGGKEIVDDWISAVVCDGEEDVMLDGK